VEQKYCENSEGSQEFDMEVFENARARLMDLHLIQLSEQQEQIYRLHSLIREFLRGKLEGEADVAA
jgi:ATP/maltotriose-dependent transcriptional regulator MalT